MFSHIQEILISEELDNLDKQLDQALSDCWQNQKVGKDIKDNLLSFLQNFEQFKSRVEEKRRSIAEKSDEDISHLHQEQLEDVEYEKIYSNLSQLFILLGRQQDPIWNSPERAACFLHSIFNPNALICCLIKAKLAYMDKALSQGLESHNRDYASILRLQKITLVHAKWIEVLGRIESGMNEEKGSLRYTYTIMEILRSQKLAFYQKLYGDNETLTFAALNRIQKQTSLAKLQAQVQDQEAAIAKKENSLKCYSWEKAACSFAMLAVTRNIFFSLGKEFFLIAERAAPGAHIEEPLLSGFSYLAGALVLGGQIYASPTVTGPALVAHALAQAALSDTKLLTHYGEKLFGLNEERVFHHYSKALFASSVAVSSLTVQSTGILKLTVQLGTSSLTTHYTSKAVERLYQAKDAPSYRSAHLISALAANALGFYLGHLAWHIGADFAFEHFSNETLLFDDSLCEKFQRKCLREAYSELGVENGIPLDEIKSQYHKRSREIHPDKNQDIDPEVFKRLGAAWKIIQKGMHK